MSFDVYDADKDRYLVFIKVSDFDTGCIWEMQREYPDAIIFFDDFNRSLYGEHRTVNDSVYYALYGHYPENAPEID